MNGRAAPSMLKPAMIGGGVFGLLAALPGVQYLNCACCALVIGSGFLAAFLYSRDCTRVGAEFRPGNGAMVGLVTAPFYTIMSSIVGAVVLMLGPSFEEQIREGLEAAGSDIPPEAEQWVEWLIEGGPALLLGIGFVVTLVVAAVFATIGGAIGGAVFKVEPPAPAQPMGGTPPPPPPPAPPAGGAPPPTV